MLAALRCLEELEPGWRKSGWRGRSWSTGCSQLEGEDDLTGEATAALHGGKTGLDQIYSGIIQHSQVQWTGIGRINMAKTQD